MRKMMGITIGLISTLVAASVVHAQTNVLVSGSPIIAIVDGNGDGPGAGDCMFSSVFTAPMTLAINTTQDANNPLLACATQFLGTAAAGANFANANIMSSVPPAASLPVFAQLVDNGPPGLPLTIDDPTDLFTVNGAASGVGTLCAAGGPAATVTIPGGGSVLLALQLNPPQAPGFLCVPNLPFQLLAGGITVLNAYVPVTPAGHITMALANAPASLILDINLLALPACTGRNAVPTATETGLMVTLLSLLAIGIWRLGKRPAFYQSLASL